MSERKLWQRFVIALHADKRAWLVIDRKPDESGPDRIINCHEYPTDAAEEIRTLMRLEKEGRLL